MISGERLHALLHNTRWGKDFTAQEAALLGQSMHERAYVDGERIINLGGEDRRLHFIASGSVHIVKDYQHPNEGEASSKSIALLSAGTLFGEISLVDRLPNSASALAKGPTTLLVFDGDDYDILLLENPALGVKLQNALLQVMARRLRLTTIELVRRL